MQPTGNGTAAREQLTTNANAMNQIGRQAAERATMAPGRPSEANQTLSERRVMTKHGADHKEGEKETSELEEDQADADRETATFHKVA